MKDQQLGERNLLVLKMKEMDGQSLNQNKIAVIGTKISEVLLMKGQKLLKIVFISLI